MTKNCLLDIFIQENEVNRTYIKPMWNVMQLKGNKLAAVFRRRCNLSTF